MSTSLFTWRPHFPRAGEWAWEAQEGRPISVWQATLGPGIRICIAKTFLESPLAHLVPVLPPLLHKARPVKRHDDSSNCWLPPLFPAVFSLSKCVAHLIPSSILLHWKSELMLEFIFTWYFIFKFRQSFFTLQQPRSKSKHNEWPLSDLIFTVAQLAVASHMTKTRVNLQFSRSVVLDCLWPHWLQHATPPCHQLPEFTQPYVHWVVDAIQPSHPLLSPSLPTFNLSQHQDLFKWVSSSHQVAKALEFHLQHQSFQWLFRTDFL